MRARGLLEDTSLGTFIVGPNYSTPMFTIPIFVPGSVSNQDFSIKAKSSQETVATYDDGWAVLNLPPVLSVMKAITQFFLQMDSLTLISN